MIILIILIILVLLSFNLFRSLFKNDVTILDDVKLKESEPSNNGFALMLQKDDGTYEESSSGSWPTDMKFNSELSGCIDINGNKIDNSLDYDSTNNIMNVSVGETAYCYVYFDIIPYCEDGETLGECLLRKNSEIESLNDNIEGGLYRYQGTNDAVNDNYVCFGTTDKDMCVNNSDKYMYRIIGIDENKQIKLIKNTSIGKYMWHSKQRDNASWPEYDLYKGLNGIDGGYYTNLFINNSTYDYMNENSNWYNKIVNYNWKYSDNIYYADFKWDDNTVNKTASEMYTIENESTNTVSAKIGLIYLHDYYYASQSEGLNCSSLGNYSTCKTAWMHYGGEWTMSSCDYDIHSYVVWYVGYTGAVESEGLAVNYIKVRPVFFLENNIEYSSGTGTISDPFLLNE